MEGEGVKVGTSKYLPGTYFVSIFNLRRSDRILMKFEVWKDIVSQSSYFRSRPDPVTFGGGDLKSCKTHRVEGSR